jgi:BlaI family penicillinase repressor
MKLTKSELEIMNVLWKAERPLSRAEILELSSDKTWKDNSIHILLNGMLKKGAIQGDGFVRSGKVWGRLYAPTIGMGEYYRENLFQPGGEEAYPLLLAAMVDDDDLSDETMDKLEEILRKRRERMK